MYKTSANCLVNGWKKKQKTSSQITGHIYGMSDYGLWKGVKSKKIGRLPVGKHVKIPPKKQILRRIDGQKVRQRLSSCKYFYDSNGYDMI